MVVCACCASIKNVGAADPTAGSKASTSRASRDAAAQAVPLEQIRPDMRDRVAAVVNNPSIFRRLPTASIQCDRDLYLLLIRNPEIVIDIWQMMGITNMSLVRTGPERSSAADGQGTTGMLEIVYRSADTHVIYSTGTYDGSLSPAKIRGESVVVLKSEYFQDADGHQRVNSRLDDFSTSTTSALNGSPRHCSRCSAKPPITISRKQHHLSRAFRELRNQIRQALHVCLIVCPMSIRLRDGDLPK